MPRDHFPTKTQGNVLVVDDTPENLMVLSEYLTREGYTVRPVLSGDLAIQAAELMPPEIILLDINMPDMNGYDLCRKLKSIDILKSIPVLFISALDETMDKVKAFESGGVDYITKPFQFEEVSVRVQTHLHLYRLELEREKIIADLESALLEVKQLQGLLPICASCKNVRDDKGYWNSIEGYLTKHSDARFSHSICPDCKKELYPDIDVE